MDTMASVTQRLFVYGTLGPDGPNRHILTKIGGYWLEASLRGDLKEAGWGSEQGYPAIELNPNAPPVNGYVFVSGNLKDHWDELDTFEGPEYERVVACVHLTDGTSIDAFAYTMRR